MMRTALLLPFSGCNLGGGAVQVHQSVQSDASRCIQLQPRLARVRVPYAAVLVRCCRGTGPMQPNLPAACLFGCRLISLRYTRPHASSSRAPNSSPTAHRTVATSRSDKMFSFGAQLGPAWLTGAGAAAPPLLLAIGSIPVPQFKRSELSYSALCGLTATHVVDTVWRGSRSRQGQ